MRQTSVVLPLALGLLAAPLAAGAQPPAKVPRIGILRVPSPPDPNAEAFRKGLRELGYVEGQNIAIEYRTAEGRPDRLPALAGELVTLKVDVIVAGGSVAVQAAKQATTTIPIVMSAAGDPVGAGFAGSLARPGGNITGVVNLAPELGAKRLELLKETSPSLARVAAVSNPANPAHALELREAQAAAQTLRITLLSLTAPGPEAVETAFATMVRERVRGLMILPDAVFFGQRGRITDLAAQGRLPAIYDQKAYVDAGGLMAYGPSFADLNRRAATFVDKILKGAKPADLPVEQPTRFELVINLKTAKALGLTVPRSILIRADQLIQ